MTEKKIDKYVQGVEQIPTLPIMSKQIMAVLSDENASMKKIATLIEKDPALAVKILKVANSAFYGTLSKVSSIDHALVILGIEEIRSILLAFSIRDFFSKTVADGYDRKRFWMHSVVCSQIAMYLARYFRMPKDDTVFLSGLIHDMGKAVFDQYFHKEFLQIINYVSTRNESFSKAEKEITGITHYQVGAKLLQQWKFPERVVLNVFFHHAPWQDKNNGASSTLLYLADLLTRLAGYTCHPAERQPEIPQLARSKAMAYVVQCGFDLDEATMERMLNQIKEFIAMENQSVLNMFAD